MRELADILALTSPLFLLAALGYALVRWLGWPQTIADALARFVGVRGRRRVCEQSSARRPSREDHSRRRGAPRRVARAGVQLAHAVDAGDGVDRMGATGSVSLAGFAQTARNVLTNPVVASIFIGTAWGWRGIPLPGFADRTLALIGEAAVPLSLIALGMGLAEYDVREGWRQSAVLCAIKLGVQPLVVYALARALVLPVLETRAVVLLAALPVGANVYLMARDFRALGGPVAASLVLSTALAAVTTPIVLMLTTAVMGPE